jgi:hypothetical protein
VHRRAEEELTMTSPGPQEQFHELTRRTQENFKHLWEQWSQRSNELLKGMGGRARSAGDAPGDPEQVLDAVFDFAENLIKQQRAFAKQMLRAAGTAQAGLADAAGAPGSQAGPAGVPTAGIAESTTAPGPSAQATSGR